MAKRITVTALQPLHHEGRSHVPGSVFTTTPVDAASLKYRRKVKLGGQLSGGTVPEHPSITQRMEPVGGFERDLGGRPSIASDDVVSALQNSDRALEAHESAVIAAIGEKTDREMPTSDVPSPEQQVEHSPDRTLREQRDEPAVAPTPPRGRRGRTYQRRDMQAESTGSDSSK